MFCDNKSYLCLQNYGVSHVDELFLIFKFAQVSSSWLGDLALQTDEDIEVSKKLVQLWTNFAKNGRPIEGNSNRIKLFIFILIMNFEMVHGSLFNNQRKLSMP